MNQTELCSKRAGLAEQIGSGIKLNLHPFHLETAVDGDVIGKKFICMPHFEMNLPHISICTDPRLCLDDQLPRLKILPHFKNLATFNLDTSLDGSDRQGSKLRSIFGSKFRTLVTRSPELCPRTVPPNMTIDVKDSSCRVFMPRRSNSPALAIRKSAGR